MKRELRRICDPGAINAKTFADQNRLIEAYGGKEFAATIGAPSSTPSPAT